MPAPGAGFRGPQMHSPEHQRSSLQRRGCLQDGRGSVLGRPGAYRVASVSTGSEKKGSFRGRMILEDLGRVSEAVALTQQCHFDSEGVRPFSSDAFGKPAGFHRAASRAVLALLCPVIEQFTPPHRVVASLLL